MYSDEKQLIDFYYMISKTA